MNGAMNCFVVNPTAGKGGGKAALIERIKEVCERLCEKYEIHITTKKGDAIEYVRRKSEESKDTPVRFYACGGDGTLNEVANGIVGCGNASLGAIPAGTGNDFIKSFSNNEIFSDIEAQLCGKPKVIDIIKFGKKVCLNVLNIGLDCNVVAEMKKIRQKINVPNKIAYTLGVVKSFFGKFGRRYCISYDGDEPLDKTFTLVAFGNGSIYGGGYKAAPYASIDDGLIDACSVDKVSRGQFLSLVGKYKAGLHADPEKKIDVVNYRKCKKIHFKADEPVGVCFDGEIEDYDEFDIEIIPGAMPFIVPRGSECLLTKDAVQVPEKYVYQEKL
ncbi:MAG: diacylglycerol kinase family lipid kinase [Clostridia bacterium]|nr:diacylglycerol kinase family lipid kinase [Clostridia bacterium]